MKETFDRSALADGAAIFGTVMVSALPYLSGLGFYGDDWQYQETLVRFTSQGLGTIIPKMINLDSHFLLRPVQLACLVFGFKAFGQNPTPYHVVISACLGLAACLLYLALRELGIERVLAFAIGMVFGLLPHYSTDRFWISSHQAVLCVAFALLGIYALSRSVRPEEHSSAKWMTIAVSALVLSILSYEVAFGFIIAALVFIGWRSYRDFNRVTIRPTCVLAYIAGTTALVMLVWILKARVQTAAVYHGHLFKRFGELSWHAIAQAVLFNLWTWGLHLPSVVISLYRSSALGWGAAAVAMIIALFVAYYTRRLIEPATLPSRAAYCSLAAGGFLQFGLGYMIFFAGPNTNFSTLGTFNRVAIASALGASCVEVASVGLLCSIVKNEKLRAGVFSVAIGVICGVNTLIVNGIGHFWVDSASQQAAILRSLAASVRSLPSGSVLLLDGFCRYSDPRVVVFGASEDTTSAIRLALNDHSLTGDVVSPILLLDNPTAESTTADEPTPHYSYGDRLFVYNVKWHTLAKLPSREAAIDYVRKLSPADDGCPTAEIEKDAKIF